MQPPRHPEMRRYVEELMAKVERRELLLEKALEEFLSKYKNIYEAVERKLTGARGRING
ncbi:MAG: hypothetical protein QXD09_07350 [Candidatus Caldarchaeum sp.]